MYRERTVQQKIDRSGPVLFNRVRPAIQYRSSTEGPAGVSVIELGYMYDHRHHCSGGGVCEWGIAGGVGSALSAGQTDRLLLICYYYLLVCSCLHTKYTTQNL